MKRIEEEILSNLARLHGPAARRLGLRFDRVALRVIDELRQIAEHSAPEHVAVLVTLTAPIKEPAKTVIGIANRLKPLFARDSTGRNVRATICGNGVRIRLVRRPTPLAPALIGFVHNPESDARRLLDLGAAWVDSRPSGPGPATEPGLPKVRPGRKIPANH